MLHVALWEPEIPPNTGNIARLCAATGCPLHLIGRLGFRIDEKSVRRAGLDYWESVELHLHLSLAEFEQKMRDDASRIFVLEQPCGATLHGDDVSSWRLHLVRRRDARLAAGSVGAISRAKFHDPDAVGESAQLEFGDGSGHCAVRRFTTAACVVKSELESAPGIHLLCISRGTPSDTPSRSIAEQLKSYLSRGVFSMRDVAALPTLIELRQHVLNILCRNDNLDPQQTPLRQALITRKGKPCGLFFQVHGPRLLKNYAIWAGDENRILFYNCNGERVAETKLSEAPDPRRLAA